MNIKTNPRINLIKLIISLIVCALLVTAPVTPAHALQKEQADAIQKLIDDAIRISGTPGISVAVISDSQTHFFNAGHTSVRNQSNSTFVSEHTLYGIGSLSKAFTAVGILLLEEQGLLSASDRIEDHLPWFSLTYKNEVVAVTIQQLLNNTSGLTQTHSDARRGEGTDMLRRTVEPFVGARLDFAPGTAYAYANANFNILGLIIEAVSGQSYEAFMKEQVFEPLGLHETFLYHSDVIATGRMAQGHRHSFLLTFPYDAPIYGGMKPTGFITSSAADMARWMGIHLGVIEDIPDIFIRVIERTHQVDAQGHSTGIPGHPNEFYTNGWINDSDIRRLAHTGQTPNFLSAIVIYAENERGVVFLSNGGSVNFGLAEGIHIILDGNLEQSYGMSANRLRDIINSILITGLSIGAIGYLITGTRNRMKYKPILTKSKIVTTSVWALLAVITTVRLLRHPITVGSGWQYILDWDPPTTIIILFIIPVFFIAAAWHTFMKNPKPKMKKL